MPAFLLGLPHLADGPLLAAAWRLQAPVLLGANAFSVWRPDPAGIRDWIFDEDPDPEAAAEAA